MKKIVLLSLLIFSALAKEVGYLARSPRAQLMGNAWTALANKDEMTLFYNPASLGGNYTVSFAPLNMKLGITNALDEMDRFQNFPSSDPAAIADRILGLPIHIEASTFPTLKMMHAQLSLYATQTYGLVLRNKVHPTLDVDYRYDRGFATGFAYNIIGSDFSRGKKINSDTRLSIGYGLKYINRESVDGSYDLFSTGLLTKISNGELSGPESIKKIFGQSKGKAYGHDIGVEFATGFGNSELVLSSAILDVMNTRFKKTMVSDQDVPMQEMYWTSGVAFKQDYLIFDYALTMDFKPINAPLPFMRKLHIGANFNLPLISLYAGWSEGYLSYGGEISLFPFTLMAGFYTVELGAEYKENPGKRAFIYLSLFDASFDIF